MDDLFSADGLPIMDPSPDEDAWEAFLDFAIDRMNGVDANGVSNPQITQIETALGSLLPFEVGLFIVIGVPDGDEWFRWGDDPAADLAAWQSDMADRFIRDVIDGSAGWPPSIGSEPDTEAARRSALATALDDAPTLFPLHSHFAVPITIADDETSNDSNPVLSVSGANVSVAAPDLAAWLHRQFDVPLPMWPETPARTFPFWSDLTS